MVSGAKFMAWNRDTNSALAMKSKLNDFVQVKNII